MMVHNYCAIQPKLIVYGFFNVLITPPQSSTHMEKYVHWSCKRLLLCAKPKAYGLGVEPS